jgi:uncharacterized protein YyaL (SSP411 family)
VAGDPVYVVLSPHLEPVAASATGEFAPSLPDLADVGLAVRRALIQGVSPASMRPPAQQRHDPIGGAIFRGVGRFDVSLIDQAVFALEHPDERRTLDFVLAEMREHDGAFVAGLRADSLVARYGAPHIIEGAHYQWTTNEVHHLLGSRVGPIFTYHYGFGDGLHVPQHGRSLAETAERFSISVEEVRLELARAHNELATVRSKRPDPVRHPPVITEFNGRMISALARTNEQAYVDAAAKAARAILRRNLKEGRLWRAEGVPALRSDFSALIRGLLDAYEATFDPSFIEEAIRLQRLADSATFPTVPAPVIALAPVESRELEEENLARLAAITGEWAGRSPIQQIVVAGDPSRPETRALLDAARRTDAMVFFIGSDRIRARLSQWMPYVNDVVHPEKMPVAAVCRDRKCGTLTTDPHRL